MFEWRVQLHDADGAGFEHPFRARWSPSKVASEEIAVACAAQLSYETGRRHVGVSAVLVGPVEAD